MKKMQTFFIVIAVVSVFLLSFLIGRASALRNNNRAEELKIYSGTVPMPKNTQEEEDAPASAKALVEKDTSEEKKEESPKITRMLFPCGDVVLNKYSQTAVYSKTMEDWRAHTGIDYAAEDGDDVCAAWDGKVTKVYKDKLWGYTIEIEHDGGLVTKYKNLKKKTDVKEGDKVKAGQIIAKVGKSASVESKESAHLHFEVWQEDVVINPEAYLYSIE